MIMNQNFVLAMKGPALQPEQSLLRRLLDESRSLCCKGSARPSSPPRVSKRN